MHRVRVLRLFSGGRVALLDRAATAICLDPNEKAWISVVQAFQRWYGMNVHDIS